MDIGYIATVLGVVLVSMTLHEAVHGYAAYFLGDDTPKHQGRLTLNPVKHIDPFLTLLLPLMLALIQAPIFGGAKPVPFNPTRVRYGEWGAALIAIAGPLTNLLLAFVAFGIGVVSGGFDTTVGQVLTVVVMVNLGFFLFNILPIPPLDGSRVLYALAPDGIRRGMAAIEQMGILLIFALVMVASPVIGGYMRAATQAILSVFAAIFGIS